MRSQLGTALVVTALGALVACSSSSSGSPAVEAEAGTACPASLASVVSASSIGCPSDGNGNFLSYDEAITATCATLKLKAGDIEYGQCFQYLVFRVDADATGNSFTSCYYDVSSHVLTGVVYSTAQGQSQCGGNADPSCTISGLNGGGGTYQSCAPVVDAGGGSSSGGGG